MSGRDAAVDVVGLEHRYGDKVALAGIDVRVDAGEIFGFLGPNGGGKTTLFRVLSTLVPPQRGRVSILGHRLWEARHAVRRALGVVFQSPSLDVKLTVRENLEHHGHLYGIAGSELNRRIDAGLERLGVGNRAGDIVETLSGGLQRRVELAKGLLPKPRMLLLDEPSVGLDPGSRLDLWRALDELRREDGTTVALTTHLLDEAERCDRLAILDGGRIVCTGTPRDLRERVGGDVIAIRSQSPETLAERIAERFGDRPQLIDGTLRLEHEAGQERLAEIYQAFAPDIETISLSRPSLEDVFVHETGHRFWSD